MTAEQAHGLAEGTVVRDTETGAVGRVEFPGAGYFKVVWTENAPYDKRMRDYLASTEWDLLDADFSGALPLEVVPSPELCGHGVPIHSVDCDACDAANAESDQAR
jgi:hypothetical protein